MRIGKGQPGFTYLGMLFFVAITSAALAALGQQWSTAAQRERERELEFRGGEIARAIESYLAAGPSQPPAYPRSLDDLLRDGRGIKPRHHLRRLYADPFTGRADWVLIPAPNAPNLFRGVHSRSERALLNQRGFDETSAARANGRLFLADDGMANKSPVAPASAAALP